MQCYCHIISKDNFNTSKKKKSILPGYKISRQKKKYETLYTPNGTNLDAYSNVMICAPTYYVHLKRFQS